MSSWWWLAAWPVTGLTVAATHHVARTAIARRSLMPIIKHNRPVYGLACDGDNCDTVAEHDDGMPIRFDSRDSAADWAREFGWDGPWCLNDGVPTLCPECAELKAREKSDQEHHEAEIAAAISHALNGLA